MFLIFRWSFKLMWLDQLLTLSDFQDKLLKSILSKVQVKLTKVWV